MGAREPDLERKLLEMAYTTDLVITAPAFAFFAHCSVADAEALLDDMAATNKLRLETDAEGGISYAVPNRQRLAAARPPAQLPDATPRSSPLAPAMQPILNVQAAPLPAAREDARYAGTDKTSCPFCGEEILRVAKKCKHCNEMLDPTLRHAAAGAVQVNVQQVQAPPQQIIVHTAHRPVSPGIAALLSFLWPGAGQLYVGNVASGLGWMVGTFLGYVALIIPGLILHLFCIISASQAAQQLNTSATKLLVAPRP